MPLVRISLRKGKPRDTLRAIGDGVHRALVETFGVPVDDHFQLIHEHDPETLIFDAGYLGVRRTDDIVMIDIIVGNWRETQTKKAFYAAVARNLAENPGLRPEDIVIVLSPNGRDDWSFGNGRASYIDDEAD